MSQFVRLDIRDRTAVVTLNRPERLNAIGSAMGEQLDAALLAAARTPEIRVVVLTGAGRGFCAGADVERLDDLVATAGAAVDRRSPLEPKPEYGGLGEAPNHLKSRYLLPAAVPKPVIAAVNGACAGAGLVLATSCDLRIASESAVFSASFARRGLTAEFGLAHTLSSLLGRAAASDILLTGRKLSSSEALSCGLVSRVLPEAELLPTALELADDLCRNVSPRSIRVIKRQLWAAQSQDLESALVTAHDEMVASLASADFREGVAHFKEKRAPAFPGV